MGYCVSKQKVGAKISRHDFLRPFKTASQKNESFNNINSVIKLRFLSKKICHTIGRNKIAKWILVHPGGNSKSNKSAWSFYLWRNIEHCGLLHRCVCSICVLFFNYPHAGPDPSINHIKCSPIRVISSETGTDLDNKGPIRPQICSDLHRDSLCVFCVLYGHYSTVQIKRETHARKRFDEVLLSYSNWEKQTSKSIFNMLVSLIVISVHHVFYILIDWNVQNEFFTFISKFFFSITMIKFCIFNH